MATLDTVFNGAKAVGSFAAENKDLIAKGGRIGIDEYNKKKDRNAARDNYADYLAFRTSDETDVEKFAYMRSQTTGRDWSAICENIRFYMSKNGEEEVSKKKDTLDVDRILGIAWNCEAFKTITLNKSATDNFYQSGVTFSEVLDCLLEVAKQNPDHEEWDVQLPTMQMKKENLIDYLTKLVNRLKKCKGSISKELEDLEVVDYLMLVTCFSIWKSSKDCGRQKLITLREEKVEKVKPDYANMIEAFWLTKEFQCISQYESPTRTVDELEYKIGDLWEVLDKVALECGIDRWQPMVDNVISIVKGYVDLTVTLNALGDKNKRYLRETMLMGMYSDYQPLAITVHEIIKSVPVVVADEYGYLTKNELALFLAHKLLKDAY